MKEWLTETITVPRWLHWSTLIVLMVNTALLVWYT